VLADGLALAAEDGADRHHRRGTLTGAACRPRRLDRRPLQQRTPSCATRSKEPGHVPARRSGRCPGRGLPGPHRLGHRRHEEHGQTRAGGSDRRCPAARALRWRDTAGPTSTSPGRPEPPNRAATCPRAAPPSRCGHCSSTSTPSRHPTPQLVDDGRHVCVRASREGGASGASARGGVPDRRRAERPLRRFGRNHPAPGTDG